MGDLIKAAKLWAKTSQKTGGTYYVGRMGGCRVLVLENRDRKGEDEPTHWLMLGDAEAGQERDPARRPGARNEASVSQPPAEGNGSRRAFHSDAPAKPSARPVERGDGWRGPSAYRRPNGPQRAPAADGGAVVEDSLEDLYR